MYNLIKKILFRYSPESIHHSVMRGMKIIHSLPLGKNLLQACCGVKNQQLEREVFGLRFCNPVGLAAGFDKDAKYIDELASLGFGFVEIGTVTPLPQPGNDLPRLFRLPADKALINRMGFNNEGAAAAAKRLQFRKSNIIVGGNIGKNKVTPNEEALSDYEKCFHALYEAVDYFVVNVSSPNTPNLRALQEKEPLKQLLHHLQLLNAQKLKPKPILLKIAPDLTNEQLDDIIEIVQETKLAGIVATNTTISREGLVTDAQTIQEIGAGGLSGLPVKQKATEVIRYIHTHSKGSIPIIAVGGIFTAEDAQEKLDAGAALVQVYTGFIYEGPTIVKKICKGLR
ncbi:quinone-dependent dihydroorotate dehydrogenase [Chitinophaga nivalis]|uniref:Dihydroorotate dehydrogenase (quinone) n=1 Tax=Chitinophaga nivalis TaxID=2991709 RepID=A0ABT3ITA6_9BACT|nr:quinone-dependent dihydroorotate dehydrogenase [Chitinophaga nivalis]MCW3463102.1 quinone-dependent dihydroorotate dehydrogenase [Chitinophaga nivalis]MCW3487208.1 quinone-dependent dihydroorotate dehydrogenase [Chitinophaga nivalis]